MVFWEVSWMLELGCVSKKMVKRETMKMMKQRKEKTALF